MQGLDGSRDGPVTEARASARERADGFARRHFSLKGSLRLHRASLGHDLLLAPLAVMLAPVFLLVRLAALGCRLVGLRAAARWLATRRIVPRTRASRVLEEALHRDLLGGRPLDGRERALLHDYVGIRSAVAEITTTLVTLAIAFAVFRQPAPGVVTLAPLVSQEVARAQAVADFPLGASLGAAWYRAFPAELPVWFVVATGLALAVVAALVTTFAGLIADPVQRALGLHRRRLERLLLRIESSGEATLAAEHLIARIGDLSDAALGLVRWLRS